MSNKNTSREMTTAALRTQLEQLVKDAGYEHIPTLLTRGNDGFDFHDISAAGLRHLLQAAYAAGLEAAKQGVTTLTEVEGEEYVEADYLPLDEAPEPLTDESDAHRVGTHGRSNTWLPLGGGRYALVYTTWINATGWVKIPATYKANGSGFERTAWQPKGFDYNHMREEANAEALAWALAN